jgi:hypothetical protein|tara:strand:- start:2829 stop:3389 length:561 start_codon:yes stop_codon:yes gene_type:complete
MKLYIGVTQDNELYYIKWDKVRNEQTKTFSLSGGTYSEPVTEEQGEQNAFNVLSTSEYWEDIGDFQSNSFLSGFIDFKRVADHVINTDGWENTNGEYTHFGEYNDEEVYLNYSCGGQHQIKREDLKECWINKELLKKVYSFWDNDHLKPLKQKHIEVMNRLFNDNPSLTSDQEVLIKYLKAIEWRQ